MTVARVMRLLVVAALLAAAVAVSVAVVHGGQKHRPPPAVRAAVTAPEALPDPQPPLSERAAAIASGGSDYVISGAGAILRLDPRTLTLEAATVDPAGPLAVVESGGRLYVADRGTLLELDARTLAPVGATALPGAVGLAGGSGRAVVTLQQQGSGGQLCLAGAAVLSPCTTLPFVPAGAVFSRAGTVYVVDRAGGEIVPYAPGTGGFTPGTAIPVGSKPQGAPVQIGGDLYVAVERGIAVVDLARGAVTRTIRLAGTPSALAATPVGLAATIFGSNALELLDTAKPAALPVHAACGRGPVAAVLAGQRLAAIDAGSSSVALLDARTGALVRRKRLPELERRTRPARAESARVAASGRDVRVTIPLAAGRLTRPEVAPRSAGVGSGRAVVNLWQGGISGTSVTGGDGLVVQVEPAPGRLTVTVVAAAGAFAKLTSALTARGGAVVLTASR